ncbi:Na(+)-translocating NADH-quinone reductase subunit A [Fibrobacterota bacterium]
MTTFKIKKGRTLNIKGTPEREVSVASSGKRFALLPPDFAGIKGKLSVNVGDKVQIGEPLMYNRSYPEMVFTSPAGGKVVEINRGDRRVLLEVVVEADSEEEFKDFPSFDLPGIEKLGRPELVSHLLASGMWPYLIQRPFSKIADPSAMPKSIFINAMDTEPNCADKEFLLQGKRAEFQAGVHALKRLTEGKLFLCYGGGDEKSVPEVFDIEGAETHQFTGPHPAGNVGTHIHYLDPINKGEVIWHISAEHLALIGGFLLRGKIPVERVVALSGSSALNPRYVKTRMGADLKSIVNDQVEKGEVRFINGGVLTGRQVPAGSYLGFYNSTVTLIPEGRGKETAGWLKPGLDKPSFSRMFFSAITPFKKNTMDTRINGEARPLVATHVYDSLVALDVYTEFLVKACLAQDVEAMEELGILECAPEDFSLCTYACVSKLEVDTIIREGLELMEKEG